VSNLSIRSLVAFVGIPLLLSGAYVGGLFFFVLVLAISLLGLSEFHRITESKGSFPNRPLGYLFAVGISLVFLHEEYWVSFAETLAPSGIVIPLPSFAQSLAIIVILFVLSSVGLEVFRDKPSPLFNIGSTIFGGMYVSLFLACLIGLRSIFQPAEFPVGSHFDSYGVDVLPSIREQIDVWGGRTVCSVFASIWVCDSAAYFAGRAFGRKKLMVRVSPNKTWEGAVAGFIAATATLILAREFWLPYLSMWHAVATGCIIGLFGQCGDLAESLLKRDAGIKDSSTLIPGHGGMLDRFDSLMFVSPILFLYYDFIVFAR